jgi:N-acetylglutamate synthase-like GNAT family acetyltransferase
VGFLVFEGYRPETLGYIFIDYIVTLGNNYGFGARLMEELKDHADDQRYCQVFVQSDDTAIEFYDKLGFIPHEKDEKIMTEIIAWKNFTNSTKMSYTMPTF